MTTTKIKLKIKGIPDDYASLPFGRQIEYNKVIQKFKENSKSVFISIKRRPFKAAFKEFLDLYGPSEYYMKFNDGEYCRDHSIEIYYKK